MMKGMKRFIPLIILVLALFLVPPRTVARAETLRYAVAADSNVWFYTAESEEDKLFLLPETYYVRILSEGETYSAVEYLVNDSPYRKLMGYCRTDALLFVDFIPARPYLRRQVTATYSLPDAGGTLGGAFSKLEKTFVYYGSRYDHGQLYYYVLADGEFGYIPADAPLEYERNDDWLSAKAPSTSGEAEKPTPDSGVSAWQIVVLVLIALGAVAVAFFVLRGKRSPHLGDPES